jgi:hypothetical protein
MGYTRLAFDVDIPDAILHPVDMVVAATKPEVVTE